MVPRRFVVAAAVVATRVVVVAGVLVVEVVAVGGGPVAHGLGLLLLHRWHWKIPSLVIAAFEASLLTSTTTVATNVVIEEYSNAACSGGPWNLSNSRNEFQCRVVAMLAGVVMMVMPMMIFGRLQEVLMGGDCVLVGPTK